MFDYAPYIAYENGDGSVPLRSLSYGDRWNQTILLEGYRV